MQKLKQQDISLHEAYIAKQAISPHLPASALIQNQGLSELIGAQVYVKHENQNLTGSFKIRGGINFMVNAAAQAIPGVITFSTGNHGLSIAKSAQLLGIPAIVVVPEGANPVKIKLIEESGAEVIQAGKNFDEASVVVARLSEEKQYYYVHPANEPHIINGVATEFLEIMDQLPQIEAIVLPLGGGSEVAAAVTVFKSINPNIEIYAVQAELSSAAYHSWRQNKIVTSTNETFAGGFATGTAYETTFDIYKDQLTDFVLLAEEEIIQGIALATHHTKQTLEGAGASTIMAAWKLRHQLAGKHVVLQFSGSNASQQELNRALNHSSFSTGKVT